MTKEPPRLAALRSRLGAEQRVTEVSAPPEGWLLDDEGVLRHERTDFFHVTAAEWADGSHSVLMVQPEQALVGLVVARRDGVRHALLTARCEPGLHEGCQLSSTVQSTPSNYLRRHGGAATPHLELVLDPPPGARVLHDSSQYDWGQYYLGKTKRFVIVEVDGLVDTREPCTWVDEDELVALVRSDFAITSDLRCALALLLAHDRGLDAAHRAADTLDTLRHRTPTEPFRRRDLRDLGVWGTAGRGAAVPVGARRRPGDAASVTVRAVEVVSRSREVEHWHQPLLAVAEPLTASLPVRGVGADRRFAIERRSARGLRGVTLWYPAGTAEGSTYEVRTSAEGGRFLRHEVVVALGRDDPATVAVDAAWVGLAELLALCARPEATSVELRLALSLAVLDEDPA